ncbi:hypothetical protein HNR00_001538 [Methylorubrum rhodinum]|uniref:Uncharacterized protein n=1 Tax=Methylorubrum rhodinum TaxID=29428 RepID=A0A840ZI60_9HYPH|nr:hypothetical protein [Methylorubrum rhodinum]
MAQARSTRASQSCAVTTLGSSVACSMPLIW